MITLLFTRRRRGKQGSRRLLLLEFVLNKYLTLGRDVEGETYLFPSKIRDDPFDLRIHSLLYPGWWPAALQPFRYRRKMAWRRAGGTSISPCPLE